MSPLRDTCVEYLRYEFTEDEVRDLGRELARKLNEQNQSKLELQAVTNQFKEKTARLAADIGTLSRQVDNGYEHRNTECRILWNRPDIGECSVFRMDTGEMVRTRAMTVEERQVDLPFPKVEAVAAETEAPTAETTAPEPETPGESESEPSRKHKSIDELRSDYQAKAAAAEIPDTSAVIHEFPADPLTITEAPTETTASGEPQQDDVRRAAVETIDTIQEMPAIRRPRGFNGRKAN